MNLVDELHAVSRALSAAGISFAVCGGIAVTIHGATRTTKDIDLLGAIHAVDLECEPECRTRIWRRPSCQCRIVRVAAARAVYRMFVIMCVCLRHFPPPISSAIGLCHDP